MNNKEKIKWLKEHNENAFKEHNILEIEEPKEVVVIEKEEYESLKEENQRLNNDIKVLLKENESKEKVIMKYENVLNELRENAIAFINIFQDEKTLTLNYNDLKHLRGIINGEEFDIRILKDKLQELKESDK